MHKNFHTINYHIFILPQISHITIVDFTFVTQDHF